MAIAMQAEKRSTSTKGNLRLLRKSGQVPGVVYGKEMAATAPISISEKQLSALLRSHPNAVVDLDIASLGSQSVMIADVQRDALNQQVMHVDFQRVNLNEKVKAHIRVDTVGEAVGVKEGGILQFLSHELEVECLPGSIPDAVEVDISSLAIGESLHVSDVTLPAGVEAMSDAELIIVSVVAPQKELDEEEQEELDAAKNDAEARSDEANHDNMSTS